LIRRHRRPSSRRQNRFLFDALESRLLLSNNGYANSIVASFSGVMSAAQPGGAILQDSGGDLFGVSATGGTNGDGTIWELAAKSTTLTVLASFTGGGATGNGKDPVGGLVMDSSGNLYGVTAAGGADNDGTVFELSSSGAGGMGGRGGGGAGGSATFGTITVIGTFTGTANGADPLGLAINTNGTLFGVTAVGGANSTGAVFDVAAHAITDLASFPAVSTGANAGADPRGNLVLSGSTLFGSTTAGGADGFGALYSIGTSGNSISPVAPFTSAAAVNAPLIIDGSGNIFGVGSGAGAHGHGFVFEEAAATPGSVTDLADFTGFGATGNGSAPSGGLLENSSADLFGLTASGGSSNGGTVFEIPTTGANKDTILTLDSLAAGADPASGMVADTNGDLFATTSGGGTAGHGALVELTPVKLVVTGAPTLVGSGQAFDIGVQLEGPTGTVITNDDSTVTLSLNGTLQGTTSLASHDGAAAFDALSVVAGGTYTITANDANGDTAGASTSFVVAPPPAASSVKLVFPAAIAGTSGTTIPTFTVDIEDADGNIVTTDDSAVTVSISSGPAGATLGGVQIVQAVNGVATFTGIPLIRTGNYKLVATDAKLTKATSGTFQVLAAPELVFATQPANFNVHALSATPAVVEFLDQFGNVITNESKTVKLIVNTTDGGPGVNLSAGAAKGIATFTKLQFPKIGTYTLTASATGAVSVTSNSFVVGAGPAVKMTILEQPPDTSTGDVFGLTIELFDKYGNVATGDASTVSVLNSSAQLTGTLAVPVLNGLAVFSDLVINRHGSFVLTVKDTNPLSPIHTRKIMVS
jgi:uncharacterized repeat protein (TIGR03803 family)